MALARDVEKEKTTVADSYGKKGDFSTEGFEAAWSLTR
jgi:hypothetical protein